MTCCICGNETENYIETDAPRDKRRRREWRRIPVCPKLDCQRKVEKELKKK